jgi:hypothetical protein
MSKNLLSGLMFVVILSSCISTSRNNSTIENDNKNFLNNPQPVTTTFENVDTGFIMSDDVTAGKTAVSLTELPRTQHGAFVLSAGFYEAEFKTYCLQPGTPGPSVKDAYFQAPLIGSRKDIIESVLRNSQRQSNLDQKNIQLLLWSVVSRSDFNKLAPSVQSTAKQLLNQKQVFELQGGMLGVVKTVAKTLPGTAGQSDLLRLFDQGITSYEAFERLAVTSGSAETWHSEFKREQWYKHSDGYYVRYLPTNYKQTKIQVFVPEGLVNAAPQNDDDYVVFDPTSLVVVPANSNAQRLGIGGPILDVVRSVIIIIGSKKEKPRPKQPTPTTGHPGAEQ